MAACAADDPIAPRVPALALARDGQITLTATDLGPLGDGGWVESAVAINDHGEVVGRGFDGQKTVAYKRGDVLGYVQPGPGVPVLYRLWVRGTDAVVELPTNVTFTALNNRGQVVGGSEGRAIVWTERDGMRYLEQPASATSALATDINEGGDIVGVISPLLGSARGAAIWPTGGAPMSQIPPDPFPPSTATAINNEGLVVGLFGERQIDGRGFVRIPGEGLRSLETPLGWASHPAAINDRGLIVGIIFSPMRTQAAMWDAAGNLITSGMVWPGTSTTKDRLSDGSRPASALMERLKREECCGP